MRYELSDNDSYLQPDVIEIEFNDVWKLGIKGLANFVKENNFISVTIEFTGEYSFANFDLYTQNLVNQELYKGYSPIWLQIFKDSVVVIIVQNGHDDIQIALEDIT